MKKQKGFTLIELIIVIVILGILAVTAAPKFFDFSSDARKSTVKGAKAAIQGAAQVVYGKAAIAGQLGATGTVEGIDTVYGYPEATEAAITAAASLAGNEWDFNTTTGGNLNISPEGVAYSVVSGEECFVTYAAATAAGEAPTITSKTDGC